MSTFFKRRSILFRTTLLSWLMIILTLGIFIVMVFPYQKKALFDDMMSKAKAIASSIAQVTASAVVSGEYDVVIDHCMTVLRKNPSILYLVLTKQDGYSLITRADRWSDKQMGGIWNHSSHIPPEGMILRSDLVGERVFHYSYPFSYSGINWGWINIGLSLEKFNADLELIYHRMLIILVLCAGAGLVMSYYFARQLSRPIFRLADITQRVGSGDLSARAEIATHDELESLAHSLNSMTAALQKSYEDLRNTQAQLVQSGKMSAVGQLAAGVAHEINNPLSGILIHAKLLRELISSPKLKDRAELEEFPEYVDIILEATYRCKTIIENLLSFSRQSNDTLVDILDMNEVIEKSLSLIATELRHGFIIVKKDPGSDLPRIEGNLTRLQQVFINILLNAHQFMPDGGEISISTALSREGKYVEARIKDTGPGIPKENLEKIFEPFFTTMSVAQGSGRGTGLGLSISYGIIKEHKGLIEVESEQGKGATFIVKLPVYKNTEGSLEDGAPECRTVQDTRN